MMCPCFTGSAGCPRKPVWEVAAVLRSHAFTPCIFPNWLEVPGGEMLPGAGTAAVKHSEHQTAPYISHIVDEEVETLTHLVNALLVLQRPNVGSGSQGAQCRATVYGGKLGCAGWGCRKGEQHIQSQA